MNDVELVAGAMREIEVILSQHIEPDHVQDAEGSVNRIFDANGSAGCASCGPTPTRRGCAVEASIARFVMSGEADVAQAIPSHLKFLRPWRSQSS
jgi:hypothetical protein